MMKKFKSLIIILVLVMMFFPIGTLAFGNYSESYKKTWGDNSKDYVRTITGNACQVSDGVVVLSLSPDLKVIDPIIDTIARGGSYGDNDTESQKQALLVLFDLIENNIVPTITITKYDDNGKVLWEDKFTDGFSFYYGMVSDSEDNVYVIGLKGLKKYNKDGKLVSTNKDVKGYTIYKFGDYYAVFNAKLLELYDEWKDETLNNVEKKTSNTNTDAETALNDLKLRIIDGDDSLFEVKFYDKNFKLVKKIDESDRFISINMQACIENNKLYYLTMGDDKVIINEVDSKFNVTRNEITMADDNSDYDIDNWGAYLSTIEKTDTGFYIATLADVFKVDSNYKAKSLGVSSLSNGMGFITGMIKKGDNYLVSFLEIELSRSSVCKNKEEDYIKDCVSVYGTVRVYDNDFNYLSKFDVNSSFGFKSADLNNTITAITRIVNLNDGFMVLGANITSGYDFVFSIRDYYDYLDDKYAGKTDLTPTALTYPKTKAFLLRYGDGYKIKTSVVEGRGRVSVSKSYSTGNEKILYTVVPDEGYAVASLRVTTVSGEEISVVNNSFEMPDEEVVISVSFRKLANPNTSAFAFIWILCFIIVGVASYTVFKPEKKSN